eukprot:m.87829 g.87829  ORF g.87829 m.87829 type:complete len:168 (+) comp12841_c0_seq10:3-506(+)
MINHHSTCAMVYCRIKPVYPVEDVPEKSQKEEQIEPKSLVLTREPTARGYVVCWLLFVATVLFLSLVEMDWVTFVIVGICGPIVVATFLPETQVCTLNRNGPATWTATTLLQTYAGIAPRVNVFSAPGESDMLTLCRSVRVSRRCTSVLGCCVVFESGLATHTHIHF